MEEAYLMPQQQQTEYIKGANDLYAQEINEEKIKNILSQINPSNQLEEIELRLKGYKRDSITKQWIRNKGSELNEVLVQRYINWLSSYMTINVTMGNLSTIQINKLMAKAVEWVADDIDTHAEEYGFKDDYTERTRVADILLSSMFFVLKRSENGAEMSRFWRSFNLSETSNANNNLNKSGDWWKFWKK